MGLAESQKLLARLATDAALRVRFASEPGAVAVEFGLTSDEIRALPIGPIEEFARSLIRKRRGEVESLLPCTFRALGTDRFASEFRRFASGSGLVGIKKHRDDAIAFAGFLEREGAGWVGDLARLEAAGMLAYDPERRSSWIRLGHHPSDLARSSIEPGSIPKRRPTLVVWWRASAKGRLRRLVLARPRFFRGQWSVVSGQYKNKR